MSKKSLDLVLDIKPRKKRAVTPPATPSFAPTFTPHIALNLSNEIQKLKKNLGGLIQTIFMVLLAGIMIWELAVKF